MLARRFRKNKKEILKSKPAESALFVPTAQVQRHHKILLGCLFVVFGAYLSILYFGHTEVPNSDFPCFYQTGQEILSFKVPSSFKRGPVVGILQVIANLLVRDHSPSIVAGWLVNAILYPFACLLLYLIAEKIVGRAGIWIALLSAINPTAIYLLTEPIAETTLLFFVLLTIYLILIRSKWCWLFASITAITRYEGAALIMAAFVMDMICAKDKKERLTSFKYAVIACVPLGLWMFGTLATGVSDRLHYFRIFFGKDFAQNFSEMSDQTGVVKHLQLIWYVGIIPLITMPSNDSGGFVKILLLLSKLVPLLSFCFGAVWSLVRKRWDILVLLIFFVPYFLIHAAYPYPIPRYHATIFWIMFLICWFGLQGIWELLVRYAHIHKHIKTVLGISLAVLAVFWITALSPLLSNLTPISPRSVSVVYVAAGLAAVIVVLRCFMSKSKGLLRELIVLIVVISLIVSNQFMLARRVGTGQREKEFKILAQWYKEIYKPDDKIAVYMAPVVKLFVPELADSVVALPFADTQEEFIEKCREEGITYVVWATREMSKPKTEGYKMAGLHNIAFLYKTQDIGPYKFVKQIKNRSELVNIFRLVYTDQNDINISTGTDMRTVK